MCPECNGRHSLRDSLGRFRRHGSRYLRNETVRRNEYLAYLEAMYYLAEEATRGHMLSRAGTSRGIRPSSWFALTPPPSDRWASQELLDHFAVNGRPLDRLTYTAMVTEY